MPAQLHGSHQRISSLAKEARDVQPGLIKDSTMMRPAVSDRPPLATEAHPNPSIPEEDGVRGKAYVFAFANSWTNWGILCTVLQIYLGILFKDFESFQIW